MLQYHGQARPVHGAWYHAVIAVLFGFRIFWRSFLFVCCSVLQSEQVQSAKNLVSELHQFLRNTYIFIIFIGKGNLRKFCPQSPVPLLLLCWMHVREELVCGVSEKTVSPGLAPCDTELIMLISVSTTQDFAL